MLEMGPSATANAKVWAMQLWLVAWGVRCSCKHIACNNDWPHPALTSLSPLLWLHQTGQTAALPQVAGSHAASARGQHSKGTQGQFHVEDDITMTLAGIA
jgi:hypothetical protein